LGSFLHVNPTIVILTNIFRRKLGGRGKKLHFEKIHIKHQKTNQGKRPNAFLSFTDK
jgi:hypothetical protein